MDFWKTLKTPSPVFPNEVGAVVTVSSNSSLKDAFQVLISHNLLSVPVREFGEPHSPFVGFFTMLDLVVHVLNIFEGLEFPEGDENDFARLPTEKEQFVNCRVKDVMGKGDEPYVCVKDDEPVDRVAKTMVLRRAHRAVVLRENGELVNVITQSRLVECVNELFGIDPTITPLGEQLIGEMRLGSSTVITITEDRPALEAFKLLRDRGVCGIAVIRGHQLVGNISTHDLNQVKTSGSYLRLLNAPVGDYLDNIARKVHDHHTHGLIKCTPHDKFKTVVNRMIANRVHRCYVVENNETDKLIGIISFSDILRAVVSAGEEVGKVSLPNRTTAIPASG